MKIEEQLLEVNKKIKQIQGLLNKRKQKASEWNMDYKKIIQQKPNRSLYLERKCGEKISYKTLNAQDYNKIKAELVKKASLSRLKVKQFYNELKDLDNLQKQKTKIRSLLLHKNVGQKENEVSNDMKFRAPTENEEKLGNQVSKSVFRRTMKERSNPFAKTKAENFIQLSIQAKNNSESLGPKLMKYFGVGLQSTPMGSCLKVEQKKDDVFTKNETTSPIKKRTSKTNFGKTFSQTFDRKEQILGMTYKPRNIFEDRMRKIIKWHGNFWGEEFTN